MPTSKGHSAPGPRWTEPVKYGKKPKHGRYEYEDEPWFAYVSDKVNGEWIWIVYKDTTMMAGGTEEKLFRAKYKAELKLKELKSETDNWPDDTDAEPTR